MQTTREFLEALRVRLEARSYYHLAQLTGFDKAAISRWRKGTTFDDASAQRVAELLELHPGYVMACMNAERAHEESARAVWADVAEKLRTLALGLAAVGVVALLFALEGDYVSSLSLVSSAAASDLTGIHIVQVLALVLLGAALALYCTATVPWRALGAALLALTLGACTTIDEHSAPPADWPDLMPLEHALPHAELRDKCAPFVAWYESPIACTTWDFAARTCDVWVSRDFPPEPWVLEHERLHCLGYDHPGSTVARDTWHAYAVEAAAHALATFNAPAVVSAHP